MPGFDGTGPRGTGPMTGGGRGFCVASVAGIRPRPFGRRFFGRGAGRGWGYMPDLSEREEAQMLKEEAGALKEELKMIQERLAALEKAQGAQKADE